MIFTERTNLVELSSTETRSKSGQMINLNAFEAYQVLNQVRTIYSWGRFSWFYFYMGNKALPYPSQHHI